MVEETRRVEDQGRKKKESINKWETCKVDPL